MSTCIRRHRAELIRGEPQMSWQCGGHSVSLLSTPITGGATHRSETCSRVGWGASAYCGPAGSTGPASSSKTEVLGPQLTWATVNGASLCWVAGSQDESVSATPAPGSPPPSSVSASDEWCSRVLAPPRDIAPIGPYPPGAIPP